LIVHIMHRAFVGWAACCMEVKSGVCVEEIQTHRLEMKFEMALGR